MKTPGPLRAASNLLFEIANGITAHDGISESVQLRRSIAVMSAIMVIPVALIWGIIYLFAGENVSGTIPLLYLPLTALNLLVYRIGGRYQGFEIFQLSINLALPILLMISLGGFVSSSAVVMWSLVTPMGAIVYSSRRMAIFWFIMFLGVVLIGALADPYLDGTNGVPPWAKTALFAANVIGPSSIAFALLAYFVGQNATAYDMLSFERSRSEKLIDNMLPTKIAARLKESDDLVADRFENVSVLFADMVGSTELASSLSPEEMVGLLNDVFTHFDSITVKHGVEKISTSGDNYVVAAGVPEPKADHAAALVRTAIEMRDFLAAKSLVPRVESEGNGVGLQMRFGINSGEAVAGVVGQRNFHYDIWGDAVNTASRMESHGTAGKIQISEATYNLVMDDFVCEARGEIDVKGKGMMRTWFVAG